MSFKVAVFSDEPIRGYCKLVVKLAYKTMHRMRFFVGKF